MAAHREKPLRRTNPSGRIVWVARYTGPDGRRLSAGTFKLQREAQDAIDAAYARPPTADTLGGYLPRWLDEHPVSPRTTRTNRGRVHAVLDVEIDGRPLADWPLRELRRRQAKDLVAHLLTEQERAPEGVRNILRTLHRLAEDAIADELADVNPWAGITVRDDDKRAMKESRQARVWSLEQMHAFAAAAAFRPRHRPGTVPPRIQPAPTYEPMLRLLADCGLRIGELFALRRAEQRLAEGVGVVNGSAWEGEVIASSRTKEHAREFPIPPGCLALLRAMPPRIDAPWLFASPRGQLWRYGNWHRQVWAPTCEAAGIDPTPHEFRHSWNSALRAAGIDPADLADVAGHSVETNTRVYTHAQRRSFDAIREAIG